MTASLAVVSSLAALFAPIPQQVPPATPCVNSGPWPVTGMVDGISETPLDPCDFFHIEGPSSVAGNAPLLVLFHGFYGKHNEYLNPAPFNWGETFPLIDMATDMGWFVVMHDGGQLDTNGGCMTPKVPQGCDILNPGSDYTTFGTEPFMIHTRAVLEYVLCHYPIDRQRIYGYGFSMGGNELMTYAARHMDPSADWGMFAAVVSQSATSTIVDNVCYGGFDGCALLASTQNYCDGSQADRFLWQRANVLATVCGAPCAIDFTSSLAVNLLSLPLRLLYHVDEGPGAMMGTNDLLATLNPSWLQQIACGQPCPDYNGSPSWDPCDATPHNWEAACPLDVLSFLGGNVLDTYVNGVAAGHQLLIADDGVRYVDFVVQRSDPNALGRLRWSANASTNQVTLLTYAPENLAEVRILADPADPWTVLDATTLPLRIQTTYGGLAAIEVAGFDAPPNQVSYQTGGTIRPWPYWQYSDGVVRINGPPVGLITIN